MYSLPQFATDYILKIAGSDEFIFSDIPLLNIVYVRECLKRKKRIAFCLVERAGHISAADVVSLPWFSSQPVSLSL
jgi:hypothetical protein